MEWSRFRLSRPPFRATPDTSLYCPAAPHEAAFSALVRAFEAHGGAAALEGDPGTGKTLLGLKWLEALPADAQRVMLHAPTGMTPAEFFQAILFDLGRPYQGLTEQELRLAVHGELLDALAAGRPVAVLVDEAHNLGGGVLEEIRLLGNLESKVSKAVFVLLLGQAGLRDSLLKSAGFSQRLAARPRLAPLAPDEAVAFLRHQLRECGGRPDWLLTDEAAALLAEHARGLPRLLNRAAALSFQIADAAEAGEVDAEAVLEALQQLDLIEPTVAAGSGEPPAILPMARPGASRDAKPGPAAKRTPPAKKSKRTSA